MGSGHFLLGVVKYLEEQIQDYIFQTQNESEIDINSIRWKVLDKCIFGVDINPLAVELSKFSLWMYTARRGFKLERLSDQLKCGDSLVSNYKGYERSFDWQKEFFEKKKFKGFDAIVGNPPYVTESRNNSEIFREIKKISDLNNFYEKNCDLFNLFIIRSINLLKPSGRLGYIVPQYLASRTGCNNPRTYLRKNGSIVTYIDFGKFNVFEEATGHHSIIFVFEKGLKQLFTEGFLLGNDTLEKMESNVNSIRDTRAQRLALEKEIDIYIRNSLTKIKIINYIQEETKRSKKQFKFIVSNELIGCLLEKIISNFNEVIFHENRVINGVQTYPDRIKLSESDENDKGVFVLNKKEVSDLNLNLNEKKIIKKDFIIRKNLIAIHIMLNQINIILYTQTKNPRK